MEAGWKRISSCKPYLAGNLLIAAIALGALVLWRKESDFLPLMGGCVVVAAGLLALTFKVVHQCGDIYRVTTLFYVETISRDDVCLMVTRPGPFWTYLRIHLRRPARFGWAVSFVPVSSVPLPETGRAAAKEAARR